MAEVLSVDKVLRIVEAGEGFTLIASATPVADLVAIAAAAARSKANIRFRGLAGRPLEDLVRITVASQGRVTIEQDEQERAVVSARRTWFGRRMAAGQPAFVPAASRTAPSFGAQSRV